MSKFQCTINYGCEMLRSDGIEGIQLKVNIYPAPNDEMMNILAKVIGDAITNYSE